MSLEKSAETGNEKELQKGQPSPRNVSGLKWALVVLSILSSTFLFSLDNTIVADVQPAIVRDFQSIEKISWLSVAFLLGSASSNLTWGQVYASFDAKWVYILCVGIFEVGSAVCGAAPNMNALIVGRAICGLGGAGMYTGVMVLLTGNTTIQERPMYFGLCGLTWGAGTILGPVIGGAFTDSAATWRWCFYINLCVGAACAPVYLFLLPRADPNPRKSIKERFLAIDYLGTVLLCGICTSGLIAISFGGTIDPWNSGAIIASFVVAGVLLVVFFGQQATGLGVHRLARGVLPLEFFRSKMMIMMFLATACASTAIFVPVYFIPLFFQFVHANSALGAAVRLLPYIVFNVTFAMVNGGAMSKKPYYAPWYLFAGTFCVIGGALMFTVDQYTSTAKIYGYSILLGVGAGSFIQLSFTVAQATVEPMLVPIATGFCTFAQLAGPAVALAISNAVFLNEATDGIEKLEPGLSVQDIQSAISGASGRRIPGGSPEIQTQALSVVMRAMAKPYILVIVAGGLTMTMSLLMSWRPLAVPPEDSGGEEEVSAP